VVPAVRAALVVPEDLGEPVVPEDLGEPVVPEDLEEPVVPAALVVSESPAVPVALERGHPRARLAVALRTKSVTARRPRPDLVPLLAEED
jgi:hypothetical protein